MSTRTSPHDVLRHLDFGEQPRRRFRRPSIWHQRSCRIANNPFSHSGGEEVLLDVAGQDSTEAFEDVGHSDEARETLEQLYVGDLKRQPGDPEPNKPSYGATTSSSKSSSDSTGFGIGLYAILLIGGLGGYAAWQYLQQQQTA